MGRLAQPTLPCPAPQDLAQCVNEVKRDNETLRQITNFQLSIENLVRAQGGGAGLWAVFRPPLGRPSVPLSRGP